MVVYPTTTVGVAFGVVSRVHGRGVYAVGVVRFTHRNPCGLRHANSKSDGPLRGNLAPREDNLPASRSHSGEGDAARGGGWHDMSDWAVHWES